jgi:lytic murein transglycosylase
MTFPIIRIAGLLAALFLLSATPARADFKAFVAALWPDARAAGVSRATFDAAFAGVTPDPAVIRETRKQAEFVKPVWSYLDSAISGTRLSRGRAAAEEWSSTLASAERQYGVPARIVLGIWGMETSYGGFTGNLYVVRSLASLAYARYRGTFFRDELIQALRILEEGHLAEARAMKGSWAGAMGQTQFMPSSFMKYAVDFNGDGRKDIWSNRQDAIGSTANYLKQFGWEPGVPWGVEVTLPQGFDYRLADRTRMRPFSEWSGLGVRRADGDAMPRGQAALFLPAGAKGPKFLITPNFAVIRKYNNSDAYALAVAHLGDRIYGADPFEASWPRGEKQLTLAQAKDVQRRLVALGFPMEKIDGKLGEKSREQIRAFQLRAGLLADGHPTPALLAKLREASGTTTGSTRPRPR